MKKIAVLKLTSYMCDNKYILVISEVDGFVEYSLYSGHYESGFSNCMSNLDQNGKLPVEFLPKETNKEFAKRVEKIILQEKLSKRVDKIILKRLEAHIDDLENDEMDQGFEDCGKDGWRIDGGE